MINSKAKGARFERELANKLKARGYNCRRGQQYCGANGDADVIGLPGIHIEAKHQEKMQLYDWVWQAKRDAKPNELPAVFHKKNNHEILVTMTFDDWMILYGAKNDTKVEESGRFICPRCKHGMIAESGTVDDYAFCPLCGQRWKETEDD